MMDYSTLTLELSRAAGPSGWEDAARQYLAEKISPLVDETRVDTMGNLLAVKRCGKEGAPRVMLCAHMDQIGFVVTGHEKGYLRFAALGGVDPRMLPACELCVLTPEPLLGVVDVQPPHALSEADMEKPIPIDKLYIDVGMTQEEAVKRIPLGTSVVFHTPAGMLGEDSLCGAALDDRSCCAILLKVMEALSGQSLAADIICLFSTQEELGTRGAVTGAFGADPDYAIVLDVTFGAQPDVPKHKTLALGGGAAIGVGPNFNRRLTNALIDTAKALSLPYQIEVLSGNSGTDAWPIQVSRGGVATALVSLPLKYMHTPVETLLTSDAENIIKVLTGLLQNAGEVF